MASTRVNTTPAGIRLCLLDDIADGRARNFVVQLNAGRFHGFLVRRAGTIHGYVDLCPHASLPLAQMLDDYLTPDGAMISCDWHGALFRVADGVCIGGPCVGQRLLAWPVVVDGQWIKTGTVAAP